MWGMPGVVVFLLVEEPSFCMVVIHFVVAFLLKH